MERLAPRLMLPGITGFSRLKADPAIRMVFPGQNTLVNVEIVRCRCRTRQRSPKTETDMQWNLKRNAARIAIGIALMISTTMPAVAGGNETYAALLAAHVNNGQVDYAGFKSDEKRLDGYLQGLSAVDPSALNRADQMAFYINAYNAWTIKLILSGYPGIDSIKDLGSLFKSPWKKKFVNLNGETVSLDFIEHDILRPTFKDPRIHFAVNCASKSCPPLLAEPYTGEKLDRQLDDMTTAFINDGRSNYMDGDTLYVSRIFKWFSEDFSDDIPGFIRSYAKGDLATQLEKVGDRLKVKYLDYDWSLNGT
jgi:hypothetical protein